MVSFSQHYPAPAFDEAVAQALAWLCFSILLLGLCIPAFDSQARPLGCLWQSVSLALISHCSFRISVHPQKVCLQRGSRVDADGWKAHF
jgi:hypothetical protein